MKRNNWYVITGGPHAGKTTLVRLLGERGHNVVFEAARVYIDQQMKRGKTLQEIRKDEMEFQRKILKIKIANEKKVSPQKITFWDRGIADSVAYYELQGVRDDNFLKQAVKNSAYKKVFLLKPLPYKKDYARTESQQEQKKIHSLLRKAYREQGCEIVEITSTNKERRLKTVLANL
ncbi:hypothetical protein EPO05_04535 [Patescibacteria group bacterium]|nr:MAG: hypothetical protein EPO05_04535 [Patescibacteria group bacterium]